MPNVSQPMGPEQSASGPLVSSASRASKPPRALLASIAIATAAAACDEAPTPAPSDANGFSCQAACYVDAGASCAPHCYNDGGGRP